MFWSSEKEHFNYVHHVIKKLMENQFLKLEKCEFHCPSGKFLGYILDRNGVEMDRSEVDAVTPVGSSQHPPKELQWFFGFINFYW